MRRCSHGRRPETSALEAMATAWIPAQATFPPRSQFATWSDGEGMLEPTRGSTTGSMHPRGCAAVSPACRGIVTHPLQHQASRLRRHRSMPKIAGLHVRRWQPVLDIDGINALARAAGCNIRGCWSSPKRHGGRRLPGWAADVLTPLSRRRSRRRANSLPVPPRSTGRQPSRHRWPGHSRARR